MAVQDTAKKWLETFNSRDPKAFAAIFAPDAVVVDPFSPQPLRGREAIQKDTEDAFKAFPDMQFKLSNMLAVGDRFAADGEIIGTHKGPLAGPQGTIPATNRAFKIRFGAFARVNAQGLIVEVQRYMDVMSFMAQLGLMPKG